MKRQNNNRFKYSKKDLKNSMIEVQHKEMSLYKASRIFNIPKGTLSNKICKKVPSGRKWVLKHICQLKKKFGLKIGLLPM